VSGDLFSGQSGPFAFKARPPMSAWAMFGWCLSPAAVLIVLVWVPGHVLVVGGLPLLLAWVLAADERRG
jgi:hypothetical protein